MEKKWAPPIQKDRAQFEPKWARAADDNATATNTANTDTTTATMDEKYQVHPGAPKCFPGGPRCPQVPPPP